MMVADGLVAAADAEKLARSRTQRFDHPLDAIANERWKSLLPPHKTMTLDWLVEWAAGKLDVPYFHIDPLKIDLGAVTSTMTNAYAERYRILRIAVDRQTLTVATASRSCGALPTSWKES
jgi:general secretion pathway protein E